MFGSLFDEALRKKAAKVTSELERADLSKKKKRKRRGLKRKASETEDVFLAVEAKPASTSPPPQPSNKRPRFEKREPPGKEALELSARLKELDRKSVV